MLSKIFRKKRKKKAIPQYKLKWEKKWSCGDFDASWEVDDIPVLIRDMKAKGIIKKGASLIDVGYGSGKLSFLLAKEGFDILGIDFSESAIKHAKTMILKIYSNNILKTYLVNILLLRNMQTVLLNGILVLRNLLY